MDGCQSYDAAQKTIKSIIQINGMPKANMFLMTRAIISVFDLNRVLIVFGTPSTPAAAKAVGIAPNKARYTVMVPRWTILATVFACLSRNALT
jgi:hypothetical protein